MTFMQTYRQQKSIFNRLNKNEIENKNKKLLKH